MKAYISYWSAQISLYGLGALIGRRHWNGKTMSKLIYGFRVYH